MPNLLSPPKPQSAVAPTREVVPGSAKGAIRRAYPILGSRSRLPGAIFYPLSRCSNRHSQEPSRLEANRPKLPQFRRANGSFDSGFSGPTLQRWRFPCFLLSSLSDLTALKRYKGTRVPKWQCGSSLLLACDEMLRAFAQDGATGIHARHLFGLAVSKCFLFGRVLKGEGERSRRGAEGEKGDF